MRAKGNATGDGDGLGTAAKGSFSGKENRHMAEGMGQGEAREAGCSRGQRAPLQQLGDSGPGTS